VQFQLNWINAHLSAFDELPNVRRQQSQQNKFGDDFRRSANTGDRHVTALISKSSFLAFCLVVAASVSTNSEIVQVVDQSKDGSFVVAQTSGMERRQGRRDARQDCRQAEGLIGKDKRDCKQAERNK
jgi:SepF-like predicted cell division protein (DUF552 family)